MRAPCTLIVPKTGRIGRITQNSGRIIRGEGVRGALLKSRPYAISGRIGRIGRIIPTYAYAREAIVAGPSEVSKSIERLQTSSLSSLSSLNGIQVIEIKRKAKPAFAEIILPEKQVILPILPEKSGKKQYVVSSRKDGTI